MGRELRRVPLDFDWPLKKTWKGYINPHYAKCPEDGKTCFNGQTGGRHWLENILRLLCIAAEEAQYTDKPEMQAEFKRRGRIWPHPYLAELPNRPMNVEWEGRTPVKVELYPLSRDLLELMTNLAGQGPDGLFGFSGSGIWKIEKRLIKMAKLNPETWGICPVCHGEAIDPAKQAAHDAWEREDPPEGPGYQLWETTSEGSPVSPVFETLDALCEWCEGNATTFGSFKASAAEWRGMLDGGMVSHREGNMVFI
jgi:hypothetical protein